jgi:ATP-dependent Clp protease protease subunit
VDERIVERVAIPLLDFEKDNSNDPVTLILATVGGSVSDGFILCNIIDNYTKPLNIIVLGYAASMGTIMLAAGSKNPNVTRKCYPFTYSLLHAGSTAFSGESLTVQDTLEFNKRVDEKVKQFIVTHTNVSEEEYCQHERKQWFLDAEDMLKYGFVDEIIGREGDTIADD